MENETDQEIDPKSNANSTSEVFDESQSPIEDSDEATDYITPANVEQDEEFPEVTERILPNVHECIEENTWSPFRIVRHNTKYPIFLLAKDKH